MSAEMSVGDLRDRAMLANDRPILECGEYVLVVLNRALRGEDNAVIDSAIAQANALNVGILVYSEVDITTTYASDRLVYGWVAPKSDRAILKRTGTKAWIQSRLH